jgi:DNA-directed RNA polymerase subunit RPC12/RpoP
MELFAITCTTCKSRLKVRDQAAIGQILACPKCGGMVMIKPPPAWDEAGEQKSDLPTATELSGQPATRFDQTLDSSAFDGVDELLSDAPPKVQSPPAATPSSTPTPPASAPAPPASATPASAKPSATPPHTAAVPPPLKAAAASVEPSAGKVRISVTTAASDAAPLGPPPPAESQQDAPALPTSNAAGVSRGRYWLFMAGSVAVGIMLAFAAVTVAIRVLRGPQGAIRSTRASTAAPPGPNIVRNTVPANAEPSSEQPSIARLPTEAPPSAASPDSAKSDSPSPASIAIPDRDPLGFVKDAVPAAAPPVTSQPLARFDRLIGGTSDDPLANSTVRAPELSPVVKPDTTPARPLAPRPPPREIDLAKRLSDRLPSIETAGTPLADFVELLSDMSTIPITLDVPFAPATAESPVALRLTDTTVGAALQEALASLRLEYVLSDDQLVVRRPEPAAFVSISHTVKDLTGGEEQPMAELAELLKAVVEPGTWEADEGSGEITVEAAKGSLGIKHRRVVQLQVFIALEKLRTARTPPLPHVLKLDPALFQLETRSRQAQSRLEKPLSLNFSQPTRLVTILERLGEAAGVRILVDWHDIASAGWNPAAEAKLLVSNQPLSAALDTLLNPLDLTWRIIDGQTIQVVTPARLVSQAELELYKIDNYSDALLAKVRSALGEAIFSEAGGTCEIRYEPASKCLLAWLPQPKQRELESLLSLLYKLQR